MSRTEAAEPPESAWRRVVRRLVDVRPDERPAAARVFVLLLLVIFAHTMVETVRDALLITRLPPRQLGLVYVVVAACVLPAAALVARGSARIGTRWSLGSALAMAAAGLFALYAVHTTQASVVTLYAASGLVGGVVVPLVWSHVGTLFTVTQARRLLGPIAAAGVLGGTLGSGSAAALLAVMRLKALLLVAATSLALAAILAFTAVGCAPNATASAAEPEAARIRESPEVLRAEPFLRRIALIVVVSTATALAIDYSFKWGVARAIAPEHVATFVARYYAVLNVVSLVAQIAISGAIVRRIGVAMAIVFTPFLLALGAFGALATGGAFIAVLLLRGLDGALINSVHRVTSELIYLPVSPVARQRTKPLLDGALARATQAACGGLFLATAAVMSPWAMAVVVAVVAAAWFAVAVTTRRPYLDLLRRAIPSFRPELETVPLDLDSATELVQLLGHEDPRIVIGAMDALDRRGRSRLVPALALAHDDDDVLQHALLLFARAPRGDWLPRARKLLDHPHVDVRLAAARALAQHGSLDLERVSRDPSPRMRGYVALFKSVRDGAGDPLDDPTLAEVLGRMGTDGDDARLGMLSAVADAGRTDRDARFTRLMVALADRAPFSPEWTEALSRAAMVQADAALVPHLIGRLPLGEGRETLRAAIVSLGPTAMAAVHEALLDPTRERSLRVQLPQTLANFRTRQAAELLLERVEAERDGLVRYKCIRALQRLVTNNPIDLDRQRVEGLAQANLHEHYRVMGLRIAFPDPVERESTERLLVRLLEDKLKQSLERTFRLLQIAHRRESITRVEVAARSPDRRVRANALEFIDALLSRRDQRALSQLLRAACEDLPLEGRWNLASDLVPFPVYRSTPEAVEALVVDGDSTVKALAELHRAALAKEHKRVALSRSFGKRPPVELETEPVPAEASRA